MSSSSFAWRFCATCYDRGSTLHLLIYQTLLCAIQNTAYLITFISCIITIYTEDYFQVFGQFEIRQYMKAIDLILSICYLFVHTSSCMMMQNVWQRNNTTLRRLVRIMHKWLICFGVSRQSSSSLLLSRNVKKARQASNGKRWCDPDAIFELD